MKSSRPFSRSLAMMAEISAFLQQGFSSAAAFEKVGTYKSRGKGRAHVNAKKLRHSVSKYQPHEGGCQRERNERQGLHMASVNGFLLIQRDNLSA